MRISNPNSLFSVLPVAAACFVILACPQHQATAAPVYYPATGHYYERIDQPGLTWDQAIFDAAAMSWQGTYGHLMTINSSGEQQFLQDNLSDGHHPEYFNYWVGGYQATPNASPKDNWHWTTGEPWSYTNWQSNEPNDNLGNDENALNVVGANGWQWNDAVRNSTSMQGGYFVEYPTERLPQTHVLSVGVSDIGWVPGVADFRGDVNAVNVANAFRNFQNVSNVEVLSLSSTGTTNKTLLHAKINEMKSAMSPDDTFIIYVATHGFSSGSQNDEVGVFAQSGGNAHDPGNLYTEDDEYLWLQDAQNADFAVSDDEFHDWFSTPDWGVINKLFILDSCFSGGFWGSTSRGDTGDLATVPRTALIAAAKETDYAVGFKSFPLANVYPPIGHVLDDVLDDLQGESQVSFAKLALAVKDELALYAGTTGAIIGLEDVQDAWGSDAYIENTLASLKTDDFEFQLVDAPEPSAFGLFTLGLMASLWRCRCQKQ